MAPKTAEHELSLISSTPEELSLTPISSRFSNKSDKSPTIGTKEKRILDNIRPGTSMGKRKRKHFGKSGSTERSAGSDIRLTRTNPICFGDDGLNSGSNKSEFARPTKSNGDRDQSPGDERLENVPGSAPQSDRSTAIQPAVEGDAGNSITQSTFYQFSLGLPAQNENSSEPSRSESAHLGPSTMLRSTPPVAYTSSRGKEKIRSRVPKGSE